MIYVMSYENEMKIGQKWVSIGIFAQEAITEDNTPRIDNFEVKSFEELQKFAENFYGLRNKMTLLTNRPKIIAQFDLSCHETITRSKFNRKGSYQFRTIWRPFNPSMNWLAEHLDADTFAQYAKERGWSGFVVGR